MNSVHIKLWTGLRGVHIDLRTGRGRRRAEVGCLQQSVIPRILVADEADKDVAVFNFGVFHECHLGLSFVVAGVDIDTLVELLSRHQHNVPVLTGVLIENMNLEAGVILVDVGTVSAN